MSIDGQLQLDVAGGHGGSSAATSSGVGGGGSACAIQVNYCSGNQSYTGGYTSTILPGLGGSGGTGGGAGNNGYEGVVYDVPQTCN